ncbi:MAG: ABC transporter permease [Spirochaetales bacterium]|nr:ABC transporter permease [Spirochaetales bacterium]
MMKRIDLKETASSLKKVFRFFISRIIINGFAGVQSVLQYKLRLVLTVTGIAIGVMTIIIILTIINGLDLFFYREISILGTDNLHISKIPWDNIMEYYKYSNRKDISFEELKAVQENAELVRYVTPLLATNGVIRARGNILNNTSIIGTNHEYKDVFNAYPDTGRFLTDYEVRHNRNVCVIGWQIYRKLFTYGSPIDQRLFIDNFPFRVIGILEEKGDGLFSNFDSSVFIPVGTFTKIYGFRRSLSITVKVLDVNDIEDSIDELRRILRRVRKIPPQQQDDDFAINKQDMLVDFYNQLTQALYTVALCMGIITLLIGGIGIMNIQLVTLSERTREIGIRRALGAKKNDIFWQFLIESLLISGLGGSIGISLGMAAGFFISQITPLTALISTVDFCIAVGFATAVGVFFGLYPALKAANLDPIVGLRYE